MWKSGAEMTEEERRRRKLEEALEVKSLRRIISAYLKYSPPSLSVRLFNVQGFSDAYN